MTFGELIRNTAARRGRPSTVATHARKALSDISVLWLSSLGGAGLAFFTQVVLARTLTAADYGEFAASLGTVTLLAPLAGFGLQGFWLQLFGKEGWSARSWLPASFRFILLSTLAAVLSLSVWIAWGPNEPALRRLLYLLLPVIGGYALTELVSGKLQLEERYSALAGWQLLPNTARLVLVVSIAMAAGGRPSVETVAIVYALIAVVVIILGVPHLVGMGRGRFDLKGHVQQDNAAYHAMTVSMGVSDVLRHAWPFGLAGVFYLIYYQSNVVLLKYIAGNEEAGIYNVAFMVMAAVYLLPTALYQKFLLPKLHRWANHDRARFWEIYRIGNVGMLLLGVITTGALVLLVPRMVPLIFGMHYQKTVGPLLILAFCAPIRFSAASVASTLVTQENMRRKVGCMGIVAVINVLLNLIMIPRYGAMGAAYATLFSEGMLLFLFFIVMNKYADQSIVAQTRTLPDREEIAHSTDGIELR